MQERPSFTKLFMDTCDLWAQRSTCQRLHTAAIIVKNNNIISIGYNGVPSNQPHCTTFWQEFYEFAQDTNGLCTDVVNQELLQFIKNMEQDLAITMDAIKPYSTYVEFITSDLFRCLHHYWSDANELHAELNAILQAETSLANATLYTLYSPCRQCAKSIISAKIKKVIYREIYNRDLDGIKLLEKTGIEVERQL